MRLPFLLICCFAIVLSCSDDDDNSASAACGVARPAEDLTWLREEIEKRVQSTSEDNKYCYIEQAIWNEQEVFIYFDCNPFVNKVFPVFDCEGVSLGAIGIDISADDIEESCVIWLPDDFACLINFSCVADGALN